MEDGLIEAALFDLDGVLTPTALAHRQAWGAVLAPYLAACGVAEWTEADYAAHLDGKPRYDGVAAVLASRGIELPWGAPEDEAGQDSVCALGNRKNELLVRLLDGVRPYAEVEAVLGSLGRAGVKLAVVSSSVNARRVLAAAGLADWFEVVVDGAEIARRGLPGKPAPDCFQLAAQLLGEPVERCVVIEDAVVGVAAGRAGGFGLVVGVDREGRGPELAAGGADVVVTTLAELPGLVARADDAAWCLEWQADAPAGSGLPADEGVLCTLFALGNGFLGVRGATGLLPGQGSGTFINGFYETGPIEYAEDAYGFARTAQVIQPVPESTPLGVAVDGVALGVPDGLSRRLDMRAGVLTWRATWRLDGGSLALECERLVSLTRASLTASRWRLAWNGPEPVGVVLETGLAGPREAAAGREGLDPRRAETVGGGCVVSTGVQHGGPLVRCDAPHSGLSAVALAWCDDRKAEVTVEAEAVRQRSIVTELRPGTPFSLTRLVAYAIGPLTTASDLAEGCQTRLLEAGRLGWQSLAEEQRAWLDAYWADADVTVSGPGTDQRAIRWNLFQVAQASACHGERGIGAKGVTGSGYSGHYFWDQETYVAPMLAFTLPSAARGLAACRVGGLDAAREHARELGQDGACYPWRTITGEEASAYFPAGSAQYHINADIAHAIEAYVQVSGDTAFLDEGGAEVLVETARMWASLAFRHDDDGLYHIHGVTGPDEYTALVDDNVYTNVMARHNLRLAARYARPGRDGVSQAEIAGWCRIAQAMAVPYDPGRGINPQDAHFLSREPWDFAGTPPERYPLLLHYHPMVIYRHQVLKQADVVMAQVLRPADFPPEVQRRNFDFYEPLTTGDSSLSAIPQAISAARVGRVDLAVAHLDDALRVDLGDTHHNTVDGVHLASAAGVWSVAVLGFGGLRLPEPEADWDLALDPVLPPGWDGLAFGLRWRTSRLRVEITRDGEDLATAVRLLDGPPVRVRLLSAP